MPVFAKVVSYFEEVARRGSIRRAAEYLHVTASAVDRQIILLEERIGTPLFERLPRGMRLTAAGEVLLASVQQMGQAFDSTLAELETLSGVRQGHVTLHGLQFLAEAFLPGFIRDIRLRHPGISITALIGSTDEILQEVINGNVDFGICYAPAGQLPVTVVREVALDMGVVVGPRHPLAARSSIRLEDCMDYPLVLPPRSMELRSRIESLRTHSALELRPMIEVNSIAMLKTILCDGAEVGFLTSTEVSAQVSARQLVWIPLTDPHRTSSRLSLIVPAGGQLSLPATMLLERLEAAFAGLELQVGRSVRKPAGRKSLRSKKLDGMS